MSFDNIRHVVTSTPISHELASTVRFTLDPSVVQVARELRTCILAGLACWTVVAVTRAVLSSSSRDKDKDKSSEL